MIGKPLYNLTRITSDTAIKATAGRVMAIALYGTSDAASVKLYDAGSATGTEVFAVVAPFTGSNGGGAQTKFVDLTELGGIPFPTTGIYADITGTSAVCYIWWE